jgi:esterase/lipase superfamily enzyme
VPVSAMVPGVSQVDMLVATTRKRVDPAEMFSGDRGLTPGFANITVSIPPSGARQIGEVQRPRQGPGFKCSNHWRATIRGRSLPIKPIASKSAKAFHIPIRPVHPLWDRTELLG